ncbi:MAG: phosphatase PAP2 family protein [Ferruginibacter sp.]
MIKKLLEIDRYLFLKINQGCRNAFFDTIMPFFREPKFWAPLYLFILLFVFINFGKKAIWWVMATIITVSLTDVISSKFIKPFFARPRPCMDSDFSNQVRLVAAYCGGNGSFTSSHAANHFGLAMFFFVTMQHLAPRFVHYFFAWAALVCFAQIYVGVHYPSDVIGGAMLGMLTGSVIGNFYNNKKGLLQNIL